MKDDVILKQHDVVSLDLKFTYKYLLSEACSQLSSYAHIFTSFLVYSDSPSTPTNSHNSVISGPTYGTKPDDFTPSDSKSSDYMRRGSAGVVGSMMLLKLHQSMHAPFTQVFQHLGLIGTHHIWLVITSVMTRLNLDRRHRL